MSVSIKQLAENDWRSLSEIRLMALRIKICESKTRLCFYPHARENLGGRKTRRRSLLRIKTQALKPRSFVYG